MPSPALSLSNEKAKKILPRSYLPSCITLSLSLSHPFFHRHTRTFTAATTEPTTSQLKALEEDVDTLRERTLKFSKGCAKYRDGLEVRASCLNRSSAVK